MATAAQITANQQNAQHSTGPRTAAGKSRTSQNALTHGLTARHLVIREDEREEFAALQAGLLAELAPEGAVETVTFHDLLHAAWNLQRFRRLEAEVNPDLANEVAAAFVDRVGRYQARAQRAYYRALKELRILQTNRALRSAKLDEETEPQVPAIADINELTKQTRSEVTAEAITHALKLVDFQVGMYRLNAIAAAKPPSHP